MQIFSNWKDEHARLFSKVTLRLSHNLGKTGLFTREALCELIERYPHDKYNLCTMGPDPMNPQWRDGHISGVGAEDVLRAIENGCIWLNLRRVHEVSEPYARLLDDIYAEIEDRVPGMQTFRHNLGILISSPNAKVPYHIDVPGQSLWQIAGRKRVYIYPNHAPFIRQQEHERVVIGNQQEDITYEPWFDEHALIHDLEPGEMFHWPLNAPHRVENHDCLNISVTTEHYTNDIRRTYAMNYANGLIRRYTGMKHPSQAIDGLGIYPKAALALAWRSLGLEKRREFKVIAEFKPDPKSATGFVPIPAFEK